MACDSGADRLKSDWSEYANNVKNDPFLNKALKKNMKYYLFAVANSSALNGFDGTTKAIDSSTIVSPWQIGFIAGGISTILLAGGLFTLYIFLNKKKEEVTEVEI